MTSSPAAAPGAARELLVGVQGIAPSIFVEGAAHALDFLAETAGVNAVFFSTHGGAGYGERRMRFDEWQDHGVPIPTSTDRPAPTSWINWNPDAYRQSPLKQVRNAAEHLWGDRDVLDELIAAANPRGVKVYARYLEDFHGGLSGVIPGYERVYSVTAQGERVVRPCWNHPDYRAWWLAMAADWAERYDIAGLLLGPERDAPLSPLLYAGWDPVCFCEHCQAKARAEGMDFEKARTGFVELTRVTKAVAAGRPAEGALVSILRVMLRHPEVFVWEKFQNDAKWSLHAEVRSTAKAIKPHLDVGWMVPVYPVMHDLFSRALAYDYAAMTDYSDFLKPNVYYDVNAVRLRDWIDRPPMLYRDLSPRQLQEFLYATFGYNPATEPDYDGLWDQPFSPEYVRHETDRCVREVAGRSRVYAGVGCDVPHQRMARLPAEKQHAAVTAALEAGADGILLSREYHLMTRETLTASGQAVRDFRARTATGAAM